MKRLSSLPLVFLAVCMIGTSCMKQEKATVNRIFLSDAWHIQQSTKVSQDGAALSSGNVKLQDWYPAIVPTTVMGALTSAGLYHNIMFGTKMKDIDKTPFDVSWWFLKEFQLPSFNKDQHVFLHFDGISYSANIWLNGVQIASRKDVFGAFRQFKFDITRLAKRNNVLAVEVFRARPGDPNIGFVDWNPRPPDENMGIFREVYATISGKVNIEYPRVISKVNTKTLKEAWLTVETQVVNQSDKAVSGFLTGKMEGREFSVPVSLEPHEQKPVVVTSKEAPILHLFSPRLWWCNNLGSPELYDLDLEFLEGDEVSDQQNVTFGIREIKDYFTEEGYRGFLLNGKRVLIKSAGWTDDLFLRNTPETDEIQIQYVKDMNLNSIRFENIWGTSQNIYDLCDRYGLMMLVGWSCQWEWKEYLGKSDDNFTGIETPEDMDLVSKSFEDQVLWLRNHPSIIAWFVGSDKIPHPELEKKYVDILSRIDDRPCIASAAGGNSTVTGPVGTKMEGPYEYVGPSYWYEDTKHGGAYGFNTETGIGAQLPIYESILKMIPTDKLWPLNEVWNYHCTASNAAMNNLDELTNAMDNKYGNAENLSDYLMKANVLNYESTKAMFEAFRVNFPNTTGVVQWMLNSAWPSFYWQLYDYFLIPTPAYYGVKRGNTPQQLIYDYKDHAVYAINEDLDKEMNQKAVIRLYNQNSKPLLEKEITLNLPVYGSQKIFELPKLETNSFLSLQLMGESLVADNFYCLSAKPDVYDYENSKWWFTPLKSYANFKDLSRIAPAPVNVDTEIIEENGKMYVVAKLQNLSHSIAFFIQLLLKDENGEVVYPSFWDDNYFSLLPDESRSVNCLLKQSLFAGKKLTLTLSGWNVPTQTVDVK